jgi:hypothetical protein
MNTKKWWIGFWTIVATVLILSCVSAVGTVSTAKAQPVCNDRSAIMKYLRNKYAEAPVAMGLAANGSVLEVLASPSGSWTIMVTSPKGHTCVVASGKAWETLAPKAALGPKA